MTEAGPGQDWLCIGEVTGAVGIRGELKVRPFTAAPESVADYGAVTLWPGGRKLELRFLRQVKGGIAVRASGIADRNEAEALKGAKLYIERSVLPPEDDADDFYHADLIGLSVEDEGGAVLGSVRAIYDFGAGDVLEIAPDKGRTFMVPFTREAVPVVDVAGGRLVVTPLPVMEDDGSEGGDGHKEGA